MKVQLMQTSAAEMCITNLQLQSIHQPEDLTRLVGKAPQSIKD